MTRLNAFLCLGFLILAGRACADFTLVRNGAPQAVICLEKQSTRSAQLGAFELQHHIRLMTGAKLPIVFGENSLKLPNVIYIGGRNEGLTGDSSKIVFQNRTLLLTGNDSPIYSKVDYQDCRTFPDNIYECKGSLFAVYDFLELYCNVHFYGAGEISTTYTPGKNLSVKARDRMFSPPVDGFRYISDHRNHHPKFKVSYRDEMLWRFRWRMNSLFGMTNHNQYSIYFAHWGKAKNPALAKAFKGKKEELFAYGFKGKNHPVDPVLRDNFPDDRDIPPQLCYSNPDTIRYYAQEAATYFQGRNVPGGWRNLFWVKPAGRTLLPRFRGLPFFYPIEGGDTGGHCFCDSCRKRFPDSSPDNISNNKFQFMADVAREAGKICPGAGISTLAYIQTLDYPERVTLPENLSVELCLTIYSWWHPVAKQKQEGIYRKWMDREGRRRPMTLYTYLFGPWWDSYYHFAKYRPFPGFYPWKTGKMFKQFTRDGIRGWFSETELQFNSLECYIASRICYDPSLDPDRLLDEYFTNFYGAAGPAMKEFYREIEKSYWNPANCPAEWLKDKNVLVGPKGKKHPYWGTGLQSMELNWGSGIGHMKKLRSLMAEAKAKVKTPQEKERLRRFIAEIWDGTLQGEKDYLQYQQRQSHPPRIFYVPKIADLQKNLDKVDWTAGRKTEKWHNLHGIDIGSTCQITALADSQNLYLRFHEDKAPVLTDKIWRENIEFFFHSGSGYPVLHLAVTPKEVISQFRHEMINDAPQVTKYDFQAEFRHRRDQKSWTVEMAIPLSLLPLKQDEMAVNFMRSCAQGSAAWNPTFQLDYLAGMDRYGTLRLSPRIIQDSALTCSSGAARIPDSKASDGMAAVLDTAHGWKLRYTIPYDFVPGRCRVSMCMRTDVPPLKDRKFNVGIYDIKKKKVIHSQSIRTADCSGSDYRLIELGSWSLYPGCFIYWGGIPGCRDRKIFVDYIRLDAPDR